VIGNVRSTAAALTFICLCFPALLKFQLQRAYADLFKHFSELDL